MSRGGGGGCCGGAMSRPVSVWKVRVPGVGSPLGVRGHSTSGPGVVATSETDYGLRAHSKSKAGLRSRDTAADTGLA